MSRTLQWGTIGIALVLIFGVWLITRNAASLQQEIYAKLEDKFGFESSMVSIQIEDQIKEFLEIDPVRSGLMFEAGFRKGDIVISHTKPAFYALLYKEKGKTEEIEILRGNIESHLNKSNLQKLIFSVPE